MYLASAFNAAFMFIGLPILARHLAPSDWTLVAYGISTMAIYTSFDLAANSILGAGNIDNNTNNFKFNYKRYQAMGIPICASVSIFLWFRSDLLSISLSSTTALYSGILIATLGSLFYFYQLQSIALNGLRQNLTVSWNAIIGSSIRWLGPLLCLLGLEISGEQVLIICIFSYSIEFLLSRFSLGSILITAKKITLRDILTQPGWQLFFRNALFLSGSALISQMDKIFLLGRVSSEEYSKYFLMITFCQISLMLQYPLQRYILPRYSTLLRHKYYGIFLSILFFGNLLIAIFTPFFFTNWSGLELDAADLLLLRWLAFAILMHCFFSYIQGNLIRNGEFSSVFRINLIALASGALTLTLVSGISAGVYSWLAIGTCQLGLGIIYSLTRK